MSIQPPHHHPPPELAAAALRTYGAKRLTRSVLDFPSNAPGMSVAAW